MKSKRNLRIVFLVIIVLIILIFFIVFTLKEFNKTRNSSTNRGSANLVSSDGKSEDEEEGVIYKNSKGDARVSVNVNNLKKIITNNWKLVGANIKDAPKANEDGNIDFGGYTLYLKNNNFIQKIIFNKSFEDDVIENLKVGTSRDKLVKKFGDPDFENSQTGMIGYQSEIGYIFFYDDEIAIYPRLNYNNEKLEKTIFSYISGEYESNQTNFVVNIKREYNDFEAKYDENENVVLESTSRGIRIILNGNYVDTKIELYKEYNVGEKAKNVLDSSSLVADPEYIPGQENNTVDNDETEDNKENTITQEDNFLTEIVEEERALNK